MDEDEQITPYLKTLNGYFVKEGEDFAFMWFFCTVASIDKNPILEFSSTAPLAG